MKRSILFLCALVLCLGVVPGVFGQVQPIQPEECIDCGPGGGGDPCAFGNPIDDPTFFVQQQYLDFLNRYPTGFELANDVAPLNSCLHAGNFACYNTERVHMSRKMWDHPEFRSQSQTFGLGIVGEHPNELYNSDDFVRLEYVQYLRRTWDIPGLNFWLGSLNSCLDSSTSTFSCPGCSTQCYYDSINAFLSSTEYRQRFGCS